MMDLLCAMNETQYGSSRMWENSRPFAQEPVARFAKMNFSWERFVRRGLFRRESMTFTLRECWMSYHQPTLCCQKIDWQNRGVDSPNNCIIHISTQRSYHSDTRTSKLWLKSWPPGLTRTKMLLHLPLLPINQFAILWSRRFPLSNRCDRPPTRT